METSRLFRPNWRVDRPSGVSGLNGRYHTVSPVKGSRLLHATLRTLGVRFIFGVPGREIRELDWGRGAPRWILTRHEFSAGIAAEVFGRLTGRTQAAWSTFGPGATNLATGLASAQLDRAPLLALSAQVEFARQRPGVEHQCVDQVALMRPLSKFSAEVRSATMIASLLRRAVTTAESGRPGPSYLSVPIDVLSQDAPAARADRPPRRKIRPPSTRALDRAVRMLAGAQFPVILAGRSAAIPNLALLAEHWRAPVLFTTAAQGMGRSAAARRWSAGPITPGLDSLLGRPAVARLMARCDTLLLAGHDPAEDIREDLWRAASPRIVRLDEWRWHPGDVPRCELTVVGRLVDLIRGLRQKLPRRQAPMPQELADLKRLRANGPAGPGWGPALSVVRDLRAALGPDGLLVSDVGLHKHLAALFAPADGPRGWLSSNGLGTFGFALPAALGARLAFPRRKIAVLAGDGGFLASAHELETFVRLKLPIVIVVIADGSLNLIRRYHCQGASAPDHRMTQLTRSDFAGLARSLGAVGHKMKPGPALTAALARAFRSTRPCVLHIQLRYPCEPRGRSSAGTPGGVHSKNA